MTLDNAQAVVHKYPIKKKNAAAVELGRLGGAAGRGKAKARTPEQARNAALLRWKRYAEKNRK